MEIANCNCPGQTVVGGHRAAVERAEALALERGAKRCIPLNVSAPFHTSLLEPAARELEKRALEHDLHLLQARCKHLGTENNLRILTDIYEYIRDKHTFLFNTAVQDVYKRQDKACSSPVRGVDGKDIAAASFMRIGFFSILAQ